MRELDLRNPVAVPLTMVGMLVFLSIAGYVAWEHSSRLRAAAQGNGGTPGTFLVVGLRDDPPANTECYGSLYPDGPGAPEHQVEVMGVSASGCDRGRTFDASLVGNQVVRPGSDEWQSIRGLGIVFWVMTAIPLAVLAVCVVYFIRQARMWLGYPLDDRCTRDPLDTRDDPDDPDRP